MVGLWRGDGTYELVGKSSAEVGGAKSDGGLKKPKCIIYMYEIIKQFSKIVSEGKCLKV